MSFRNANRMPEVTSLPLGARPGVRTACQTGSSPSSVPLTRELRKTATDAETLPWKSIRNRQINGAKFRRQFPFRPYILDFYNSKARLALELAAGGQAEVEQTPYDTDRTQAIHAAGIRVLQFWNTPIFKETGAVSK